MEPLNSGGNPADLQAGIAQRMARFFQIVVGLQTQPETFADAEGAGQPDGGVGTDVSTPTEI